MEKSEKLFDKGWKLLIKKSSPERGIEYMHRAAEAGSEAAVLLLAELYNKGTLSLGTRDGAYEITVDKNEERAMVMLEQLPQTNLISYIEAMKYYKGSGVARDYAKAYRLFKDIADGKTEPDFADISLLYDFEYGGRTKETDEQIRRTAKMHVGVMQFFGRGVDKDDDSAYDTLSKIDEARKKANIPVKDYWLPEHAFVLEVLKYNEAASDENDYNERELNKSDFDSLMWMLKENSEPQVVKIISERLITPPLIYKLKNAGANKQLNVINSCVRMIADMQKKTGKTDFQLLKAADDALIYYGEPEPTDDDAELYEDTLLTLSKTGDLMATVMLSHFELNASQDIEDGIKPAKDKDAVEARINVALTDMGGQISAYANTDPGDDEYALKTLKNGLNAAGQFLKEYREEAEHVNKKAYEVARLAYFGEENEEESAE